MGHWTNYGMDWWMWLLMIAGTVGLWVTAIAVGRALFRGGPSGQPPAAGSDPLRLLDERLARGEIGVEDYHRTRNLLNGVP